MGLGSPQQRSKLTDLVGLGLLGGATQTRDAVEVSVGEGGVVVRPQGGALAVLHALVDEVTQRVGVLTLVVQQPQLNTSHVIHCTELFPFNCKYQYIVTYISKIH